MIELTATITNPTAVPDTEYLGVNHYLTRRVAPGCALFTWQAAGVKRKVWVQNDRPNTSLPYAGPICYVGTGDLPDTRPAGGYAVGWCAEAKVQITTAGVTVLLDSVPVLTLGWAEGSDAALQAVCVDGISNSVTEVEYMSVFPMPIEIIASRVVDTAAEFAITVGGVNYPPTTDSLVKDATQAFASGVPGSVSPSMPQVASQQPILFGVTAMPKAFVPQSCPPTALYWADGTASHTWGSVTPPTSAAWFQVRPDPISFGLTTALTGANIVRCRDGAELVWRGDKLRWRRTSPSAWTDGAAVAFSAGGLLLVDPCDDCAYLLADPLRTSHDRGATSDTTPGQSLPAPVAEWSAAGLTLTDACYWRDGYALAVGLGADGLYAVGLAGSTPTRIASSPASGSPVIFRDSTGLVRVVTVLGGEVQTYTCDPSGAGTWTAEDPQSVDESATFDAACAWEAPDGARLIAGYDAAAGAVRVVCTGGGSQQWALGSLDAEVGEAVAPYAISLLTGGWEVGWLASDGWQRWSCANPLGTWTHEEGA